MRSNILVDLFGRHAPAVLHVLPALQVRDLVVSKDLMMRERDVGFLGLLHRVHGGEGLAELYDECVDQKNDAGGPEELFRLETAEREEEKQSSHAVEIQDVAVPDEIAVEHAEKHKPHVAASVDVDGANSRATRFGPGGEQDNAGAEEHGEEGAHLAFGEDPAEKPGCGVDFPVRAVENGLRCAERDGVIGEAVSEVCDVHDEDAHERESADKVDGGDSL